MPTAKPGKGAAIVLLLTSALLACASLALLALMFIGFVMGTGESPGVMRGLAMAVLSAHPVLWCVALYRVLVVDDVGVAVRAAAWSLLPLPLAGLLLVAWKLF